MKPKAAPCRYPDVDVSRPDHRTATWHLLQYSDVLDLEFASALAESGPVTLWKPHRQLMPLFAPAAAGDLLPTGDSALRVRSFPLQRGFARAPLATLLPYAPAIARRLLEDTPDPQNAVLVCTTPYFAPVAELWPGPVVYWLTDLIARYKGTSFERVRALDRRLCAVATLVCPNSERLASYLRDEALCPAERCVVLPNATGVRSVLPAPLLEPTPFPQNLAGRLERPVAGVIGNLAENMDWVFLQRVIEGAPWLNWLFVGPTHWSIHDPAQREARMHLLRHPRACFIGSRPYTELHTYARAVDVAVLPYRMREPTFSGSSTRFYDHLAACHPILATDAVAELQHLEPLLRRVQSAEDAIAALVALRAQGFNDGHRELRWQTSLVSTWRDRALRMRDELGMRHGVPSAEQVTLAHQAHVSR